jgi:hypothetical protein
VSLSQPSASLFDGGAGLFDVLQAAGGFVELFDSVHGGVDVPDRLPDRTAGELLDLTAQMELQAAAGWPPHARAAASRALRLYRSGLWRALGAYLRAGVEACTRGRRR